MIRRVVDARRGTILIVTMWVVFALAAMVLIFAQSMQVEAIATANEVAITQAAAIERGVEQYILALIDQNADEVLLFSEDEFRAMPMGEGYFWLVRPEYDDPSLPLFGLVDESSKLNLNTATLEMLLYFPAMTEDLAPAIIDWRDEDSDISVGGAETEYYMTLPRPYECKNSLLETVEELFLIRGATKEIVYGQNVPGVNYDNSFNPLYPTLGGNSGMSSERNSNFLGMSTDINVQRGLWDYVTVYSAEPSATEGTEQKVNISDQNASGLSSLLETTLGADRAREVMGRAQPPFSNVFDFYVRAGLTPEEFDSIANQITTGGNEQSRRGLINVLTAPPEVLLCLPGLDETDVQTILQRRVSTGIEPGMLGWFAEALGEKAVSVGNRVTTRAYQYSADILAVSGNGRAFKRVRIVVDARSSPPKIIYRRDMTERGWPLDPEILLSLKQGNFTADSAFTVTGGRY